MPAINKGSIEFFDESSLLYIIGRKSSAEYRFNVNFAAQNRFSELDLLIYFLLFSFSLAILVKASDVFVDSAELIGLSFGVSPLIIGVTIVAFGTSLPELASSIAAVNAGDSKIVIGNVVGSNIANILLVLGIASIYIKDLPLNQSTLRRDYPFVIFAAILLVVMLWDGVFIRGEGFVFLAILVAYLYLSMNQNNEDKTIGSAVGWRQYFMLIIAGIFVYLGSHYTVLAITELSSIAKIPSDIISLSLLALGTSLPEVAVSIQAARKDKADIALGNVLGSNIFNTLAVMGVPSLIGSLEIGKNILDLDIWVMIAATIVLFGFILKGSIKRWQGIVLVLTYFIYIFYCYLNCMQF